MDAWNKDYSDIKNYKTVHIESYSCNERLPQSQNEDHILEQRSAIVDVPARPSGETQREAIGVINTMPDLNQDSNIKNGADDMSAYRGAKAPIMKPKHEDDVVFFGDSNTTESRPTTRTTLDQDGLHRGSISTLPSAKKKRLSNATQPATISLSENSQHSQPEQPEQTLTEKAYAAAAGVAAGVASFFVGQKSYDEDSVQSSDAYDANKDQSQDYLLNNPPILTPHADKLVAEEQQPAVHQLLNVPDIQEPVNPAPPTIHVEEPSLSRNEPSPLLTAPPIDDSASSPSTNRVSTISDHAISDNTTADGSVPHASLEVLVPPPVGTRVDSKESISSTHVVTNGMVPPPANVSEPKRKNSLPEKLKKAFRRLSLKDGKQRQLSDAEIFKNQTIQQQMSGHPASVVPRPAGEMRRQSTEHLKYTGVDKKYSHVPGVYSLNRVGAEENTKGSFVSGHLEQRRGSLQKIVGKITKNNSMKEKGEQAEISGKEKINAYKATKKVAA